MLLDDIQGQLLKWRNTSPNRHPTFDKIGMAVITWLRPGKYMMTSSNGNIFRVTGICAGNSPVPGEFPAQRPVTRSYHVFFDLCLNKPSSKQSWGWWFETLSRPLWQHCNGAKCHSLHIGSVSITPITDTCDPSTLCLSILLKYIHFRPNNLSSRYTVGFQYSFSGSDFV